MPFAAPASEDLLWNAQSFQIGLSGTAETVPRRVEQGMFYLWLDFDLGTLTDLTLYMEVSHDGGQSWKRIFDATRRSYRVVLTSSFEGWVFLGTEQNQSLTVAAPIPGSLWHIYGIATGSALTSGTCTLRALPFEQRFETLTG